MWREYLEYILAQGLLNCLGEGVRIDSLAAQRRCHDGCSFLVERGADAPDRAIFPVVAWNAEGRTVVSGKAAPIASGKPLSPSTTAIRMSYAPRLEVVHDLEPQFSAFRLFDVRP